MIQLYIYMYLVFFQILFPYRSSQSIELSFQCYILHPCRLSILYLVAVQSLSHVRLFVIPWTAASQAFLSFTIFKSLFKLMSIWSVMPSNHFILCHPLLLPASGSFPMSQFFPSGSQSIGASASASVPPVNIQD